MQVVKKTKIFKEKRMIEDWLELFLAMTISFLASRFIVTTTVSLAHYFKVSSFMISIVVLSLGTNIPEISLALRSILMEKKEVALGDYLGSAAANTLFFGVFTLLNGARINISSYSLRTLILTLFGLGVFYLFSQSKKEISQKEGKVLLLIYLLFIISQILFP
jgi:cation:H+ antiporter